MPGYHLRSHLPRRYVKLVLEELESRHVPSLLGLQIDLPLSGILPSLTLSVGTGGTPAPAATTTTGTTTTSPSGMSVSFSFGPSTPSNNPTSVSVVITSISVSQQPTPGSGESSSGSSSAASSSAGSSSAGSSSAFQGGGSQGAGSTFTFPTFAFPALAIQAAQAGSSNVLGGSVFGADFELLGNLPSLLGPSNVLTGTSNTSLPAAQLLGAPYGGSVFGRLDLFTDRTPGATTAFGLMHSPPEEREESLPEDPPTPPDNEWWVLVPQASVLSPLICGVGPASRAGLKCRSARGTYQPHELWRNTSEQSLPPGKVPLLEDVSLPPSELRISPQRALPVDSRPLDPLAKGITEDFLFSEDDIGLPTDEDQPEEQSGIPAAVAILSCAVGAYWAPRFRSSRRVAAALPVNEQDA
jgi:hypothetical protein